MNEAEWNAKRLGKLAGIVVPTRRVGRPDREVRTVKGVPHIWCCRCDAWKPTGEFYQRRTVKSTVKFQSRCKPCDAALFQERRAAGFKQVRRWNGAAISPADSSKSTRAGVPPSTGPFARRAS